MAESQDVPAIKKLSGLSELHFVRQLVFMAGLAASVALGVAVVLWSKSDPYKILYADLPISESTRIASHLDQAGLDYRIDQQTGVISVPSDKLHKTRLALASNGLPQKANRGLAILDRDSSLGTSNFIEQARYTRALQEELVATIESMENIREARVHLSIPKQSSFIRSRVLPSASVMLNLYPGTQLDELQIAGLKHLVAASTAGLSGERVSVVDQQGNLLSSDAGSALAAGRSHLRLKERLESQYAQRIIDILTPLVGAGRVRAQVSAMLDFTEVETTREEYDPATVLRSEQSDTEQTNALDDAAGVPGLLENDPNGEIGAETEDVAATASTTVKERRRSTRNYEVDRSVSYIKSNPGSIQRLSVAVLVDYGSDKTSAAEGEGQDADAGEMMQAGLDAEQHARLLELVKQTIGFEEARGDSVSLIESDFVPVAEPEPMPEAAIWDNPMLWDGLRYFAAGLVLLFIIFGVLRPVAMSSVKLGSTLPQRRLPGQDDLQIAQNPDQVSLSAPALASLAAAHSPSLERIAQINAIVESEPTRAARLIEGWVVNDG